MALRAGRPGRSRSSTSACRDLQARRRELAALLDRTVVHGAGQDMEVRLRHACPLGVDIALAVTDLRHHRSRSQHRLGCLRRAQPPLRFFLRQRPLGMRHLCPPVPCPDAARNQPQQAAGLGVQSQHRMQQNPRPTPLPISPRPRRFSAVVRKLSSLVSWIANTCRPPTAAAVVGPNPRSGSPMSRGHWPETGKTNNPTSPSARQPANADALARDHPLSSRAPFFPGARPRTPQRTRS